ncbi:MAG: polysaccharide biosynthesis/export family protein [Spongiibacteraceae bacterium]|nr:polysaccharide biosynthesis/export family protein [Spongiibacteraceae bacterium]
MVSAADSSETYRLGPGDLIQIQVYGEQDLTVKVRLEEDGYLSYPFLGEIRVAGSSIDQLQQKIRSGLRDGYLVNPDVRVYLLESRPVYVNGQVRKPGGYAYVPGLTVQKAIALAGGLTDLASQRGLFVMREGDSYQNRVSADLNMRLGPGDTLVVEERFF